jgi:hypothetical protein
VIVGGELCVAHVPGTFSRAAAPQWRDEIAAAWELQVAVAVFSAQVFC